MVNQLISYRYLRLFLFAIAASNVVVVHSFQPALTCHGSIRTSSQTTPSTFWRRTLSPPATPRFKTTAHNANIDSRQFSTTNSNDVNTNRNKTVVIAGATGYIGRAVVQESIKRGYNTVALVRNETWLTSDDRARLLYGNSPFAGATIKECNVQDVDEIKSVISSLNVPSVDAIISCLASPSGTKKDVYAIDYQATLNCLLAGQFVNARHFVLLSAFCCRNPLLQLQQAKLRLEAQLASQPIMTWSVVRPTAYFKSISGQLDAIRAGSPYVLFGDGAVTRCNPIAESELAEFMLDCLVDESKCQRILNVGGPDQPLTNQMLGEMMFNALGMEPKFVYAPTWIFDYVIRGLEFLADLTQSPEIEDAAETARIGKYYAVEDMLTIDEAEKYGRISTRDHFARIAAQGQDPFTPVRATAGIAQALESIRIAMFVAPVLLFTLSNSPQKVATGSFDFSLILASLSGHSPH